MGIKIFERDIAPLWKYFLVDSSESKEFAPIGAHSVYEMPISFNQSSDDYPIQS